MRLVSRAGRLDGPSNVLSMRPKHAALRDEPELTTFRGLLVATSLSALFWAACITAFWLMRSRT